MKAGALDCLPKPFNEQYLLDRVHRAVELDAETYQRKVRQNDIAARISSLSKREREVFDGIVAGKTTQEIATSLELSKKTVDSHRASLMVKMRASSVVELVCSAMEARSPAPQRV